MKTILKSLIFTLLLVLFAPTVSAANITKEAALEICKRNFKGEMVDYYVKDDSIANAWTFLLMPSRQKIGNMCAI